MANTSNLFVPTERSRVIREKLVAFMREHLYDFEEEVVAHMKSDKRWSPIPGMEPLKAKAKEQGLWNLFLPLETDNEGKHGAGLTNLEYAPLAEEMGRLMWASEIFNCSAPDTGNMEVLARYASEPLKQKYLKPLLEGTQRSCFAMTEPAVASSDATNIASTITPAGNGEYVCNGRKWWTSGACDSRVSMAIFMATRKDAHKYPRHERHTMAIVPMNAPGVTVHRPLMVFGYDDAPHGHAEVSFDNVRIPAENLILGEGRGFEIAQGRLGPGRIHHCMRLIGMAERAFDLMKKRVSERVAFGKPLMQQGAMIQQIAELRCSINQCRLLTLHAAQMMDEVGNKKSRDLIAMIKVVAPKMACHVIDCAIQAHGGAGVCQDTPLAHMYASARSLRIADGPDEVHKVTIARIELKRSLEEYATRSKL
eukprot:TRINITY_DN4546_c7_g1_i1.p1 TRINITY_DN4546_c7_g1~~TRINITY_DN4546_c7_g1_i1.p1  ORF type:complete len:430 (-),score=99.27 TRINITY_DN4546_c7_g1_i1:72-1340(-)